MKQSYFILKVLLLSWLIGGSGGEVVACTAPTASEFSHSKLTAN